MATYEDYANNGSLLFGDMGTALLIMRLEPSSTLADLLRMRAAANTHLPIRELMWGMPGSMLACLSMNEITGEAHSQAILPKLLQQPCAMGRVDLVLDLRVSQKLSPER
jgi:hypothetical protein